MKKIVILEGLPCVGKTTIIDFIKKMKLTNVNVVDEIILENNNYCCGQTFFMENDITKINKYNNGVIVIDRGPISTLSYNEALKKIYINDEYDKVINWFIKNAVPFYKKKYVITYYLKRNQYVLRYFNEKDPYGSVNNQKILEDITIKNIKKYCANYKIIEYKFENMEEIINEIIN